MDRENYFNYFYLQIVTIFFLTIVGIVCWLS